MAALDAVGIAERPDVAQPLADLDRAAYDPVERAAVEQFRRTFGNHPRRVAVLGRLARLAHRVEPGPNPSVEVVDPVAADAQLDHMERHAICLGSRRERRNGRRGIPTACFPRPPARLEGSGRPSVSRRPRSRRGRPARSPCSGRSCRGRSGASSRCNCRAARNASRRREGRATPR